MATRLDQALVYLRLATSRERAKAAIAAGQVWVDGSNTVKASTPVTPANKIELRGETLRYVGRGGLKLEKALAAFGIDLTGARCVDLGASTGGFTDCMLQNGAAHVHAIDVGHGQLDARLLADPRVTSMEGTDARDVTPEELGGAVDFVATDVSFISLGKVLPAMAALVREGGRVVCLIKPQFEAGPEHVGKNGVVKDPRVHVTVIERVVAQAVESGLVPLTLDFSPIKGPAGNIEYLLYAAKGEAMGTAELDAEMVVARAQQEL